MANNIGIFINNTNSEMKYSINLNNYNNLKDNFNSIIIVDEDNSFSTKLFNEIDISSNNNIYLKHNSNTNILDFDIEKIIFSIKERDLSEFKNITFISDNYIYLNNLEDYFNYINSRNIDLCSFTDSSEIEYHCQLYLFSINTKCIEIFKKFLKSEINNHRFIYEFPKIFDKKIPFLKIAYLEDNLNKNIFHNNDLYKYFIINDILPIISLYVLKNYKDNFKYTIFDKIPDFFDITIYRKNEDLANFSDNFLYKHFLQYGQYEYRNYSNDDNINFILPSYIRQILEKNNLLYFFDINYGFNVYNYKKSYSDLTNLNEKEVIFHWIEYGIDEKKTF